MGKIKINEQGCNFKKLITSEWITSTKTKKSNYGKKIK